MLLNLGCGRKKLKGFVNVDFQDADIAADLTKPLPFGDNEADEVHAYHVIEHFYAWEAPDILADWRRVLKPDGLLVLELPCLDKILQHFVHNPQTNLTMWGLYGDPGHRNPAMCHRWAYSYHSMQTLLESVGFRNVNGTKKPLTHVSIRDMRFEARK